MADRTIGIILNGATGRICSTQHLRNALVPIRDEGGLTVGRDRVVPRLLLVGRDRERVAAVAEAYNTPHWTTDLDAALSDADYEIFFDAAATHQRHTVLAKAIAAGKHIYSEKPVTLTVGQGLDLLDKAEARGVRHGAVEDKIYMPGLQKLADLVDKEALGKIVGFRLEFGWWVFDGFHTPCQRPSWNYRRKSSGGLVVDMYPHWRYVIEGIVGRISRVISANWTATPERVDEAGQSYAVDVDDTAATLLELENGAYGTIFSSWATRVRRDDLFLLQIDGTLGSAMAGLHRCWIQLCGQTPKVQWNPNEDVRADYRNNWDEVPDLVSYPNSYRMGWEAFLRHVAFDEPMPSNLAAGVRDVQLAEACYRSMREGAWMPMDELRPTVGT